MIPHRWWIRATYITTGRPWVTTDELERPQRAKLATLWLQGLEPGWAGRWWELYGVTMPADRWPIVKRVVHNVVAHPLLVLCPPLGQRLHDRTAPPDDDAAEVVDRAQRDPLTPFLDRLAAEQGPAAPYVLMAPADVACRLTPGEAMAMVRLGLTHVPNDWQPGTFSIVPSADDARGVLIIPSELVDDAARRSVNESGWPAP